jgi:hypothetical protein
MNSQKLCQQKSSYSNINDNQQKFTGPLQHILHNAHCTPYLADADPDKKKWSLLASENLRIILIIKKLLCFP